MAACFHPSVKPDEDSANLFSTSNSPEGSASPSSSNHHSSPPQRQFISDSPSYDLTVRKLSYTILHKKLPPIKILDSVSFVAKSSELLGIVGASGTGKSTLLRIMSGRVKQYDPSSILLNIFLYRYPLDLDTLLTNEYWSSECFSWKTDEQGVPRCALTGYDVLKSRGLDKGLCLDSSSSTEYFVGLF